jgi:hypothetical protein
MRAGFGGSGGVPAGEQVLWRGASDADRVARRWLRSALQNLAMTGLGLALFVVPLTTFTSLRQFLPFIIGFFAIFFLPQIPLGFWRARRTARERSYVLTDQRVLIQGSDWHRDLRLVNLPDLRLAPEGDGYGTITFEPPSGGGPDRYLRRVARWIPQLEDPTALLVTIPQAERVMALMSRAQADALAAVRQPSGLPPAGADDPVAQRVPATEAPVARQSFMRAAGVMPYWFGGAFLGMGLLVMLLGAANAAAGGLTALLFGVPFAAIGAVFVRARYVSLRTRHHLQAFGVRVRGQVVDVAGTGTQVNDVEQWVVRYRFSAGATERDGQSDLVPWATAARFAPGDEVRILYDPADPSLSEIEGFAEG